MQSALLGLQFGPDCPRCPHGPMLTVRSSKPVYRCSAFRDGKSCKRDAFERGKQLSSTHPTLEQFQSISPGERVYCFDCDRFLLKSEAHEATHKTLVGITDQLLRMPSYLLVPTDRNDGHAQYFFALDSLNQLYSIFSQFKFSFVLCVGAPRLHEFIQLKRTLHRQKMDSFLLDMDYRLKKFHCNNRFALFNMVNGFYFDPHGRSLCEEVCTRLKKSRGKYLIFCDPPFAAPLALIVEQLRNKMRKIDPTFSMLDYKITYSNHSRLDAHQIEADAGSVGKRRVSVVRIFTNLKPSSVRPPEQTADQFRYCSSCERYSSLNNIHCFLCNSCPTKHGPTYVHCADCDRCWPPSRSHCAACGTCVPRGCCVHSRGAK